MHIKRFFDFIGSLFLLFLLSMPIIIIFIVVKITSSGSAIYWSERVGQNNVNFLMPKFRTMKLNTPTVASHKLKNKNQHLTRIGGFLRRTSLDELPQLFSIIKGDMSFVGPRPALFNQKDLILLRTNSGVHKLLPGVTGLAQISGRDNISIQRKVDFDLQYMKKQSFWFDMKIVLKTISKVLLRDNISH